MTTSSLTIILIIPLINGLQTFESSINEYQNSIISCDDTSDCSIICDQPNACKNTQINCPIGYACDITCSSTKACAETLIIATHSSSLVIHDCATGNFTCKGISIYVPPNNNGIPRAIINGANDGLSQGGGYNNTLDREDIIPMNFYAIYGWNDIEIVNYSGTFKYQGGMMHCTIGYTSQCQFNNNSWECADSNHICSHTQIQSPITSQFPELPQDYILNKSEKSVSGGPLWYIANILIISIITLILIFIVCVARAYQMEKRLLTKCNAANVELNKLQKSNVDSPANTTPANTNVETNVNNDTSAAVELGNVRKSIGKRKRNKTLTDENIATEILSHKSMISIDTSEINNMKSLADNNCINHAPITPNDEWDKQINSLQNVMTVLSNNDSETVFKKYVLKLSDIPTPNSMMNSNDRSSTITKTTMSLQSLVLPRTSYKSENSSMIVMCHEMGNKKTSDINKDGSVKKNEHETIFMGEKLSVLNDVNEDEFD